MTTAAPATSPASAPQPGHAVTPEQVQVAMGAAFEVLNGAPPAKLLELADKIAIAKIIILAIAKGELQIMRPIPAARPPPPNI